MTPMRGVVHVLCAVLFFSNNALEVASAPEDRCRPKLREKGVPIAWVDRLTRDGYCSVKLCREDYDTCMKKKRVPLSKMVLVFSDEFEEEGRTFNGTVRDKRWTASDMYYSATRNKEIFKPDMVWTQDGALKVEFSQKTSEAIGMDLESHEKVLFSTLYRSGQLSSWNKFCFTGGYLEVSVKFPGTFDSYGLWPAVWMMGNMARAGYLNSSAGFWPYSYNECEGSGKQRWSRQPGQSISACPDGKGFDRKKYGMVPGIGRGSPEIDILEIWGGSIGNEDFQYLQSSLQMAPLLPPKLNWLDDGGPGVHFHGNSTEAHGWYGELSGTSSPRPGNKYTDTMSASTLLKEEHWKGFQKVGLDWNPGEYIRWYLNDEMIFELSKEALGPRSKGKEKVEKRMIPMEPMYLLIQVAMSDDWGGSKNLKLPTTMDIDYIRLYQQPGKYNLGCSPPKYPTRQWIACHPQDYMLSKKDAELIEDKCEYLEDISPKHRDLLGYNDNAAHPHIIPQTFSLAFSFFSFYLFFMFG